MEETYKYSCDTRNYKTNVKASWKLHMISDKHMRNGEKKSTKCELCDYQTTSHWNVKLHMLTQHSTLEERKNHKYYCEICDTVFLRAVLLENHINGTKHANKLKKINKNTNNNI